MTPQQLKNSILQRAIEGKLVEQRPEEGTAKELLKAIKAEKAKIADMKIFKGRKKTLIRDITSEENLFKIPDGWEWVRLGEIADVFGRIGFRGYNKSDLVDKGNGAITLSPSNMLQNGKMHYDSCTYLSWEKYEESPEIQIIDGDILVVKTGSSFGKSTIVNDLPEKATINPQIAVLKYVFCDKKYLLLFLLSPIAQQQFKSFVIGTSIPTFSQEKLLNMLIPLPPLAEQKRIVAKIEELLPLVEEYNKAYTKLATLNAKFPEDMKKSILQYAIEGKLVEQRPEEGTAKELLKAIKAEKAKLIKEKKIKKSAPLPPISQEEIPFHVPESWEWVRLGNLIQITSGDGLTSKQMIDEGIPVYGGNGITGYHNDANVFQEKIVIGRVGFYCGSVHITENKAWVTDNAFITTYPEKYIDRAYLVYILRHMNLGKSNNATAQPVVSGKKIYPLLFPLPPLAEQKRIVAKLEELLPLCEQLANDGR